MNCLFCKRPNANVSDIRGREFFEEKLIEQLNQENEEIPNGPLHVCVECMARIYNAEQNNPQTLVVRQLLRNTEDSPQFEVSPTNYPSPDSSGKLLTNESIAMSESESLTPSLPPMSQLTESLNGADGVPLLLNSNSLSSNNSSFEEFQPPMDPRLMQQYIEIISRPGPKSLKRRRLNELVNNNSQEVPTRNILPAESNENLIQANILRLIHERTRLKKPRNNTSSASLVSNASSASNASYTAPASQQQPPVLTQQSSQDNDIVISPRSSQLTQQSPSVEPLVTARRHRLPSSSLSSNEEREEDRFGRPVGAISGGYRPPSSDQSPPLPPSPDHSPPLPPVVQRVSPPLPATVRRRVNDGNAHSNSGAPRRVSVPSLITPATGGTGRNPRATKAKMINGG